MMDSVFKMSGEQQMVETVTVQRSRAWRRIRSGVCGLCLLVLCLSGLGQLPVAADAVQNGSVLTAAHVGAAAGLMTLNGRRAVQMFGEKAAIDPQTGDGMELSVDDALRQWMTTFLVCALLSGAALGLRQAELLELTPALNASLGWAHAAMAGVSGLSGMLLWGRKRWRGA